MLRNPTEFVRCPCPGQKAVARRLVASTTSQYLYGRLISQLEDELGMLSEVAAVARHHRCSSNDSNTAVARPVEPAWAAMHFRQWLRTRPQSIFTRNSLKYWGRREFPNDSRQLFRSGHPSTWTQSTQYGNLTGFYMPVSCCNAILYVLEFCII